MSKLFVVALILSSVAGPLAAFAPQETAKQIQSIRQSYAAINRKQALYRKVKRELSGFSTEGGELTAYFEGQNIVKMLAIYYGEMGRTQEEYYFREGKLIFVLGTEKRYNRPLTGKVVSTKLSRFYFDNDKLIRWIDPSGKLMAGDSAEYQQQEKDYVETAKKFTDGARSSNKTIESDQ